MVSKIMVQDLVVQNPLKCIIYKQELNFPILLKSQFHQIHIYAFSGLRVNIVYLV